MTNAFTRGLKRLFGLDKENSVKECSCCEPKIELEVEKKSLNSTTKKAKKKAVKKTVKAKKKGTNKK